MKPLPYSGPGLCDGHNVRERPPPRGRLAATHPAEEGEMQIKKTQRDERYTDLTSAYADQSGTPDEYTVNQPRPGARGPQHDAEAEARQPARQESVVDAESTFDGKYETARDLRILGHVSGEIVCRGLLTIEQDASAKAKIQARDVQVRGRVEGDLVCSGRLTITSTGVVSGTIKVAT